MLVNLFSRHSSVNVSIIAGPAETGGPAVGKCWAKPSNLKWLGVPHIYSSKVPNTLVILSQNRLRAVVSAALLTSPCHIPQQCLHVHKAVLHKRTARMRASRYPHTPPTSPSLTSYFPSTEEHSPGKTLTLAETTATSFSIKVLILSHLISGFHASKLPLHVELRKQFCWRIAKWLLLSPEIHVYRIWRKLCKLRKAILLPLIKLQLNCKLKLSKTLTGLHSHDMALQKLHNLPCIKAQTC